MGCSPHLVDSLGRQENPIFNTFISQSQKNTQ